MSAQSSRQNREAIKAKAAALRTEREQADRRKRLILILSTSAIVAAVVIAAAAVVTVSIRNRPSLSAVQSFTEQGTHTPDKVTYAQTPPAGGPHNPQWLNCGIYDQPVANENAVHDMEHGAVWITYRPDLSTADVDHLKSLVRGQTYLTLSPYPQLPAAVVASAWGKQLKLTGANDPRLPIFLSTYRNGAQAPERGGECTAGVGVPSP